MVDPYTRVDPVTELDGNPEVGTVVILRNIHGDMFHDYDTLEHTYRPQRGRLPSPVVWRNGEGVFSLYCHGGGDREGYAYSYLS